MKKILFLIAIIVSLVSCVEIEKDKNFPSVKLYDVQVIDSCEYIISFYDRSRTLTHKGNCKFCQLRNKQIVIDTVCANSK